MIFFRSAPDVGKDQQAFSWDGDWPPPPVLALVTNPVLKTVTITNAPLARVEALRSFEELDSQASSLPNPAPKDENWFRGAQYIPVSVEGAV